MTGSDIAGMEDVRADRLEDRLDLGEELGRRPDHDRDRAGIRPVRAAAHRRIDHLHTLFGEPCRHLAGLAGITRRHVGPDLPRPQYLGDPALAEPYIAH